MMITARNQFSQRIPLHRKNERTFDTLEGLAATCSHVPNKGEQLVRYQGYYSNVCRRNEEMVDQDEVMPYILQPEKSSKNYCKNWLRVIP
jgi:hypothetical protein